MNPISAGAAALSTRVTEMHKYIYSRHSNLGLDSNQILEHNAVKNIADSIGVASKLYSSSSSSSTSASSKQIAVLMVIQTADKNAPDQRWVEYELWNGYLTFFIFIFKF